jgi:hypothetical protein
LLVGEVLHCCEVLGFVLLEMLVRVGNEEEWMKTVGFVAQVLEFGLQVDFDLIERFD